MTTEINIISNTKAQIATIKSYVSFHNGTYESILDGQVQVVKFNTKDGKPAVAIFKGKQKNPISTYKYATIARMNEAIELQVQYAKAEIKRKAEKKARPNVEIAIGDILYTSWGYDQTNIDFYLVVGLVGKATAEYVSIGSKQVEQTSWCSADISPDISVKGTDVQRGRIGQYGVKIGSEYASKTKEGQTFHSSWGH